MSAAKVLHISADLTLPYSAVTATTVVYGGKGMGKTNFGAVFIEELAKAGLRWSLIDPMGVAWGIRHSMDGNGAGVECLILGGAHGDIPIEPTGGAVVADLVADENASVILDISRKANGEMWSIGERIRFATDYGRQLFKRQGALVDGRRREPICQIIDEAARFVPQMVRSGDTDAAKCESVWSAIVEEGRNIGIGVVLLTQRSARLNKNVAELADMMLAFRTVGPNSIEAVLDWLGAHVPKDRMKTMAEQVRSLPVGSCLAVSPGWLGVEKVIAIRKRETFDSSATPKPGAKVARVRGDGAKPDLAVYAARMAETIERAKADDPRALRKRIAELEAAAAKAAAGAQAPMQQGMTEEEREVVAMLHDKLAELAEDARKMQAQFRATHEALQTGRTLLRQLTEVLDGIDLMEIDAEVARDLEEKALSAKAKVPMVAGVPHKPVPLKSRELTSRDIGGRNLTPRFVAAEASGVKLDGPAQRILGVLAQFRGIGVQAPDKMHVCLFSGYSNMTSKGFANAISSLRTAGLVDYPGDGKVALTPAGIEAAPAFPPIAADADLQERIYGMLSGPEQRILRVLIDRYPEPLAKTTLMASVGYSNATSKGFANSLSRLSSLGFVRYPERGEAAATAQCFLPRR